jgi:hypothetical protein
VASPAKPFTELDSGSKIPAAKGFWAGRPWQPMPARANLMGPICSLVCSHGGF